MCVCLCAKLYDFPPGRAWSLTRVISLHHMWTLALAQTCSSTSRCSQAWGWQSIYCPRLGKLSDHMAPSYLPMSRGKRLATTGDTQYGWQTPCQRWVVRVCCIYYITHVNSIKEAKKQLKELILTLGCVSATPWMSHSVCQGIVGIYALWT